MTQHEAGQDAGHARGQETGQGVGRAGSRDENPLELAGRVRDAGEKAAALGPEAAAAAVELREAVEAIHGAGLRAIVRTLLADERGTELLREAAREPAARTILLLHSILRPDIATQAGEVLARLRPALLKLGGDVEVDHTEGQTLYVRLSGALAGNSMTALGYQEQVCEVLAEQVEGLESVEVAPEPPAPAPPVTIPLDALFRRTRDAIPAQASSPAPADGAPGPAAPSGTTMPPPAPGEPNQVADSLEAAAP